MALLDQGRKQTLPPIRGKRATEPKPLIVKELSNTSDCGSSAESIVEDCNGGPISSSSCKIISVKCGNNKMDVDRIREALKKRRLARINNAKSVEVTGDDLDCEAWIERELENGVQPEPVSLEKRKRIWTWSTPAYLTETAFSLSLSLNQQPSSWKLDTINSFVSIDSNFDICWVPLFSCILLVSIDNNSV